MRGSEVQESVSVEQIQVQESVSGEGCECRRV